MSLPITLATAIHMTVYKFYHVPTKQENQIFANSPDDY